MRLFQIRLGTLEQVRPSCRSHGILSPSVRRRKHRTSTFIDHIYPIPRQRTCCKMTRGQGRHSSDAMSDLDGAFSSTNCFEKNPVVSIHECIEYLNMQQTLYPQSVSVHSFYCRKLFLDQSKASQSKSIVTFCPFLNIMKRGLDRSLNSLQPSQPC